jgi:hypothetical protein
MGERLALNGQAGFFNPFHNALLCSPSRAAYHIEAILIDNPSAPCTNIEIGPSRLGFHLGTFLVAREETIRIRRVFTYANPSFIVPRFVGNLLSCSVHYFLTVALSLHLSSSRRGPLVLPEHGATAHSPRKWLRDIHLRSSVANTRRAAQAHDTPNTIQNKMA